MREITSSIMLPKPKIPPSFRYAMLAICYVDNLPQQHEPHYSLVPGIERPICHQPAEHVWWGSAAYRLPAWSACQCGAATEVGCSTPADHVLPFPHSLCHESWQRWVRTLPLSGSNRWPNSSETHHNFILDVWRYCVVGPKNKCMWLIANMVGLHCTGQRTDKYLSFYIKWPLISWARVVFFLFLQCIYSLADLGCNLEAPNTDGETALHIMVKRNRLECVMGLLSRGADASAKGCHSNTTLHMAIEVVR